MLSKLTLRNKVVLAVVIIAVVAGVTIGFWQGEKNPFRADETPHYATANLGLSIEQNNERATGWLIVSDSCSSSPIPLQDGFASCLLQSPELGSTDVIIERIQFSAFEKTYSLPVSGDNPKPIAIKVPDGTSIYLNAVINTDDSITLYQQVGNQQTNITTSGLIID